MQYTAIQEQFNSVIEYSQGYSGVNTDELFEKWLDAKRDFIEVMGGKLIYEYPETVYFELGPKEKSLRVDDFISMVENRWDNYDLSLFIEAQKEGFFSNQVVESYNYNGQIIPKGMKLLKAFKFFESNTKVLNDIQSAASMIIQEDKVEGKLCLSVHPLDFLSSSENTHNWRSCHALDGDYRGGNLSYMVDKSTIMCYLKSAKNEKLPNFPKEVPWNSKKWRVLLFFSNDWNMIFAGRQYPFYTESGLNFVKDKILSEKFKLGDWSEWTNKKIRGFEANGLHYCHMKYPYIPIGNKLKPLDEIVVDNPNSLQFDDLLYSSCYDCFYSVRTVNTFFDKEPCTTDRTKVEIGGAVPCCKCGQNTVELSETFLCNDCELEYGNADSDIFSTCPCCGNRFIFDDGFFVSGAEETICPHCAEENAARCEICGDLVYTDDIVYDKDRDAYVCKWCKEDLDIRRRRFF